MANEGFGSISRQDRRAAGRQRCERRPFGVAPLWHGLCGMRPCWWVAYGIVTEPNAAQNNTFQHQASLVGIIAIRFDSRWRYQKSPYLVRVFRAFRGRECLNSNGRLTELGRRSSGHDLPERLRRLATAAGLHYSDLF